MSKFEKTSSKIIGIKNTFKLEDFWKKHSFSVFVALSFLAGPLAIFIGEKL